MSEITEGRCGFDETPSMGFIGEENVVGTMVEVRLIRNRHDSKDIPTFVLFEPEDGEEFMRRVYEQCVIKLRGKTL